MDRSIPVLARKDECTGCLACIDICPTLALNYSLEDDGHFYVSIDLGICIRCNKCVKTCPIVSKIEYGNNIKERSVPFAAWAKDDNMRNRSASGGAFSALALAVLENGGYVVGAVIDGIDVKHTIVDSINDLSLIQGSKYLQSNTTGIYKRTGDLLKQNSLVLFSGTPCQIAGLLSYLKVSSIDTNNLLTADLVCGGVPSRLLISSFMESLPYKVDKIVSFRNKKNGWKSSNYKYELQLEDVSGVIHSIANPNLVINGFCSELTNRFSCYNCKFACLHRTSDFTLADYWGDGKFVEQHFKGLSLLLAHSQKALSFLESSAKYLVIEKTDWRYFLSFNRRLYIGRKKRENRIERKYLSFFFKKLSYRTLKKIYGADYNKFSIWMIYKVISYLISKFEDKASAKFN